MSGVKVGDVRAEYRDPEWANAQQGLASDLPAARPQRFLPLRHEGNAGFAIWGRR